MKRNQLGDSDLHVSEICIGTMTFGQQNTLEDAKEQLDHSIAEGINFIDTAELYAVPPKAETQGLTEEYVGEWLKDQKREDLIVATKIVGSGRNFEWFREGKNQVNRDEINRAVDDSLKRLKTDYIDLYQIHWPDRYVSMFGAPDYDVDQERETVPIAEQLEVFKDLIDAGKIRYIGLSNENAYGVCEFSHLAKQLDLPKVVSIQNAFHLMNRQFHESLAEPCRHHRVSLLAYSPLAFGFLTGKHINGYTPDSRLGLFENFDFRYRKPNVKPAVLAYKEIADKHGLSLTQMAIEYVRSRWFVASTIIGATTMDQLKENLASTQIELTDEIIQEIDEVHLRYPNPAP